MSSLLQFYKKIDDPRGFFDECPDPRQWRQFLRQKVYRDRRGLSDISKLSLRYGYEMHECLFSRKYVPKANWQQLLFSGPNVLILTTTEHIPYPPTRVEAYWLSVIRYGKDLVDQYINSLPFKSNPSRPWRDSNGAEVIARIPFKYRVASDWDRWYDTVYKVIDLEG